MSAQSQSTEKHWNAGWANLKSWKPGQSGNPGGVKKGTVFVSEVYKRLLALPLDELEAFVPSNAAEVAALNQVRATMEAVPLVALPSLREITDRTEGKAPQRVEHTGNVTLTARSESLEQLVAEHARKHGLDAGIVKERLLAARPELRAWAEGE